MQISSHELIESFFTNNESELLDVIKELLVQFNKEMQEFSKEYGITGNIEQIPGESMAGKLASIDQLFFGEENDVRVFRS